jgi:hypothetical protein
MGGRQDVACHVQSSQFSASHLDEPFGLSQSERRMLELHRFVDYSQHLRVHLL